MKLIGKLLFIVLATFITIYSCKKQDSIIEENVVLNINDIKIAKQWLNEQKSIAKGNEKLNIDSLITNADWSNATMQSVNKQQSLIYIPLITKNINIGIAMRYNKNTLAIDSASLFLVKNKTINSTTKTGTILLQYLTNTNFRFTGSLTSYSIFNKFKYEYGFEQGTLRYTKVQKTKPKFSTTETYQVLGQLCTDWFWVTTYIDGTQKWEYIYTTCNEDCQVSGTISVTDGEETIGTFCGGGGGGGGDAIDPNQQNHAKMCGHYNWGTIGNAWYTQFNNATFSLLNRSGAFLTLYYGTPCIQLAKSNVPNVTLANDAWNEAWNYAVDELLRGINNGGPLGDEILKQNMTTAIRYYLNIHYPGSTFNPTGCQGNVPRSNPSFCP